MISCLCKNIGNVLPAPRIAGRREGCRGGKEREREGREGGRGREGEGGRGREGEGERERERERESVCWCV